MGLKLFLCFLFFAIVTTPIAAKAHNSADSSITMSWANVSTLAFVKLAVYKHGGQATIIYSLGNGMNKTGLVNDTAYANADKQNQAHRLGPMVALYNKYRIYLSDTVKIVDEMLNKIFARVASSTNEELSPPGANDRGVLDGVWIDFDIATESGMRKVTAESPLLSTHPILYGLLQRIALIYRQSKTHGYVDKEAKFY